MNCISCGHTTRVLESRLNETNSIRRRRCCTKCNTRFTTVEVITDKLPATFVAQQDTRAPRPKAKVATPKLSPEQVKERNRKRQENWKRADLARDDFQEFDDYDTEPDHLSYEDLKTYL